ncbi:MAG TPA: hypothetical protein DCR46_05395 [Cytophagales bacterium]|nr:hypothetical protein [Cytophagales bacterium]
MKKHLNKYKQVVKFGLVGAVNTVFTLSLILLFGKLLGLNYLIVNPMSYLLPTITSFYFNKKWTFKSNGKVKREGFLFFVVIGVAWLVQYCFLFLAVEAMKFDSFVAQIAGMVVFTSINFLGQKFITFKS